jgi:hypothetical protein
MSLQSFKRLTSLIVILVLAAASALAKNERRLTITNDASIGGKTLQAGNYNVDWVSHSPQATVTFYSGKDAVATVEGKWVDRGSEYKQNAVLYENHPDGSRSIVEIRFAGMKQALVLGSPAPTS